MDKIQKVFSNLSNKVDIRNPQTITIIIAVIIIIFAIIYVYQSRKTVEGFASYSVTGPNDTVLLGDLNKVKVGTTNTNLMQAITLDSAFDTNVKKIIDENIGNFVTNDDLRANISSLPQIDQINNRISESVAGFVRQVDVGRQINSAVQNLASIDYVNGQVNAISTPAFTIIAIFDTETPKGWQVCDGAPLRVADNITPFLRNNQVVNTPDLRGRTIIGTGQGTNMTNRALGAIGGAETHKLTIPEMPIHDHNLVFNPHNSQWTGWRMPKWGVLGSDNNPNGPCNAGGDQPHNNMQPFVALTYIIKQPVSNSVTTTTTTRRA